MNQPVLYIILNNHFDPTWRRCFDRRFTFNGETYVSYADLEEYYLLDHLELAREHPEYKFEAESSIIVRKFLERHPEALTELQSLTDAGRFAITGGGENIVDGNMILGESLVRNYVSGLLWVEQTFGRKTRLAVRNDAFGNSAQLPQILRGVEIAWCTGFSYSPAKGRYWRGLDGSTILTATLPTAARGGGVIKYPPCPACHGAGCPACHMRGFDDTQRALLPDTINAAALETFNAALVSITPEEYLPNPELLAWAKAQTGCDVRFALEEDVLPHIQPWLDTVDNPPEGELHPSVELNPNNSGVLVSRIQTKQNVRRQEYALLATETLGTLAALQGGQYPQAALSAVWQDLLFTMFHDAITATHVDAAYAEIQDFWRKIDDGIAAIQAEILPKLVTPASGKVTVMNLTGEQSTQLSRVVLPEGMLPTTSAGAPLPVVDITPAGQGQAAVTFLASDVPALGTRSYGLASIAHGSQDLKSRVIENQRYRIRADENGLLEVFDKTLGRAILQPGEYRPGELIMEHDEGSPWATLHPDQTRTPLSQYTQLVKAEQGAGFQRLTFAVEMPWGVCFASRGGVKGTVRVTLVEGLERVDFQTHIHWATFNHRLRVAFPVPVSGKHLYGIPYGMLERQPYEPWFAWAAANGDWPAVNWGGVQGEGLSVALLNKGTPSYRMEKGKSGGDVLLLSILRSPAIPTYLHEPEFYSMTAYDGMRDEGEHAFEYAVTAYDQPFAQSWVTADAEGYNAGFFAAAGEVKLPQLPSLQSDNVRLAAIKWAEDGSQSLILRLVEYHGQAGKAEIHLPDRFKNAAKVNLLERGGEILPIANGKVQITVRAWEIATLRLDF